MPETTENTETTPGGRGRLGERSVARIGYGAMQLEHVDHDDAVALLRHAVEHGVDHVDTAPFYGDGTVDRLLADALGDDPAVAVVSKVGAEHVEGNPPLRLAQRPEQLRTQVEASLRATGRERLDVVNLRRADVGPGLIAEGDQRVDLDDQLAVLIELREAGSIGALGLSNIRAEDLERARDAGIVEVQNSYGVLSRRDEDLLATCARWGIAWVPYFPLGSAFAGMPKVGDDPTVARIAAAVGATASQVGLAWLLAHEEGILLIPGTRSIAHLDENLASGTVVLSAEQLAELDALAEPGRDGADPFA